MKRKCLIAECVADHYCRGYCTLHYQRWKKGQSLEVPPIPKGKYDRHEGIGWAVAFWSRVKITANPDKCWEWAGAKGERGYGRVRMNGRIERAHRAAWATYTGEPLDSSTHILHSCDNPACVNPNHLRAGTHQDNMSDMAARNRSWNGRKTHCKNGHAYTVENTRVRSGRRVCRACNRDEIRRRKLIDAPGAHSHSEGRER